MKENKDAVIGLVLVFAILISIVYTFSVLQDTGKVVTEIIKITKH